MSQQKIIQILNESGKFMTSKELIKHIGGNGAGIRRKLRQLAKHNEVVCDKTFRYNSGSQNYRSYRYKKK